MLKLTLKLNMFREDLFKEYLKRPTEYNPNLKDKLVKKKNLKGESKIQKWK